AGKGVAGSPRSRCLFFSGMPRKSHFPRRPQFVALNSYHSFPESSVCRSALPCPVVFTKVGPSPAKVRLGLELGFQPVQTSQVFPSVQCGVNLPIAPPAMTDKSSVDNSIAPAG